MLPLIFTLALDTAAPASPADGTYTYVSALNGTTIGKTSITVTHPSGGVQFSESGGGSFNGTSGTISATLTLDGATLAPSGYTATESFGDRPVKAALAFKGNAATQSGDAGDKTYALASSAKHFAVLDFGPFSGWFALPAQLAAWNGGPVFAIVPAMGHGAQIAPVAPVNAQRPRTVPAADVALAVPNPIAFTEWYDPKTLVVDEVDIPTQGVTVVREGLSP